MRFLVKKKDSEILKQGLIYQHNAQKNNEKLKNLLWKEQSHFWAYTEKYIDAYEYHQCEVEHFNSNIKYADDYFNYYAVIRAANLLKKKKDAFYKPNESFFGSLFFQIEDEWKKRIRFIDGEYEEIDENDTEARNLIDFLGLNGPELFEKRKRHLKRIKELKEERNFSDEDLLIYLNENREELSFISALEYELGLNLSNLINS
jgi:hypothetical protein